MNNPIRALFSFLAIGLACHLCAAGANNATVPVQRYIVAASVEETQQGGEAVIIAPDSTFSIEKGYGIEPGSVYAKTNETVKSGSYVQAPFSFSSVLPEGTYLVTLKFGNPGQAANTTVKAESRRLMLEGVQTRAGETVTRTIAVNIRNASVPPPEKNAPGGDHVLLDQNDKRMRNWDDKLSLEFLESAPAIREITIAPAPELPTIFLLGDSTVTDQEREPGASWGQMFTRFFGPDVAVANHAKSGETMKSFISGLRFAKVLSQMKAGDYMFIQFGHNDQKKQWPQTYVEAGTTYNAYLRAFIAEARLRGATPVLVTSPQRRRFDDAGKIINTHGDYPKAVREVAREEKVALIDLEAMSRSFYEALGPDKSPLAFSDGGRDITHHNNYGAYEIAKMIAQSIRDQKLPLAKYLSADIDTVLKGFSPVHPDDPAAFALPASAGPVMTERPPGS